MREMINEIVEHVYEISLSSFDREEDFLDSSYKKIRTNTEKIWNEYHSELLIELSKLNDPVADYQLFWFECLYYPRIRPVLYDLKGLPIGLPYDSLPSDFNSRYNFHDSEIIDVVQKEYLQLNIKLDSWENEIAKVNFFQPGDFLYIKDHEILSLNRKDIKQFSILSNGEAPPIKYCLNHLGIPPLYTIAGKRLFYFNVENQNHEFGSIYIFASKWSIEFF